MHPTPPYGEPQGRDGGTAAFTLSGRYAGDSVRTPSGQSNSLRGLKLIPAKRRCLAPDVHRDGAQSRPPVSQRGIFDGYLKPLGTSNHKVLQRWTGREEIQSKSSII